jgi:hypothetical protein
MCGVGCHWGVTQVSGRFEAGWCHTHANMPSELWLLDMATDLLLPPELVSSCNRAGGVCGASHGARGTRNASLPLPAGMSVANLQATLRQRAGGALRCEFRSRTDEVDGARFSRAPLVRQSVARPCDGWRFRRGDVLTMLAFNSGEVIGSSHQRGATLPARLKALFAGYAPFAMHHRYFVLTSLEAQPTAQPTATTQMAATQRTAPLVGGALDTAVTRPPRPFDVSKFSQLRGAMPPRPAGSAV